MSDLSAMWKRGWRDRLLLSEALFFLCVLFAALRVAPFRWVARRVGLVRAEGTDGAPAVNHGVVDSVGRAVEVASSYTPWKSTCLVQALACAAMLRRRGVPGTLILGVAKGAGCPRSMAAHAWVRSCGKTPTGAYGSERFTVVSSFSWACTQGNLASLWTRAAAHPRVAITYCAAWVVVVLSLSAWIVPGRMAGLGDWLGYEAGHIARMISLGHGYGSPYFKARQTADGRLVTEYLGGGSSTEPLCRAETGVVYEESGDPQIRWVAAAGVPPTAWVTPPSVFLWLLAFTVAGLGPTGPVAVFFVVQALIGACGVFLVHSVISRTSGPSAAALGMLAVSLFPRYLFIVAADTHGTTLFCTLCVVSVYALVRSGLRSPAWFACHAASLALAVLTIPASLFSLTAFEIWVIARLPRVRLASCASGGKTASPHESGLSDAPGPRLSRWNAAAVLVLASVACWAPWTARNLVVFKSFLPFQSNLSMELWYGNNPATATREYQGANLEKWPGFDRAERLSLLSLGEPAYARACWDRFSEFVSRNPGVYLTMVAKRALYFWTVRPADFNCAKALWSCILLALSSFVLYRWCRGDRCDNPFIALGVCAVLLYPGTYYLVHYSEYRYRTPMEFIVVLCVACGASFPSTSRHSGPPGKTKWSDAPPDLLPVGSVGGDGGRTQ